MDQESKGLDTVQQRQINGLGYEMLPSTTVAVSRTLERQFFQKNQYSPGQEALCDMNTGAKFVNSRRSYLTFKVALEGVGTAGSESRAGFGIGSACNLIRRIVITTRSGVELSRTEDFNVLMAQVIRYGCSKEYVDQFGPLLGYGQDLEVATTGDPPTYYRFCIPLTLLSPFFKGDGKTLLPPQAAAGLRVQITFESAVRALAPASTSPVNTATGYSIDDISIMANTTTMVDSWQKALNQESASQGLTYSFPEWYTTVANLPASQTRLNIEQRKAVARSLMAFTVVTKEADAITVDNMKSESYTYSDVEWRLGSLYPTQQKITNAEEAYWLAQNAWDSGILDCKRMNNVSLADFKTGGHAICAVSLERNDVSINGVLNISGLSTNNSRVLAVDQQLSDPYNTPAKTFVFMKYLRMTKLFLDNSALSE